MSHVPTNVALHSLSIEMEAGEASAALRVADTIDTTALPIERRFTFSLEVARCYDLARDDAAVLVTLLDVEQSAPEDLARSPLARQIVTDLRFRSTRTYRRQIAALMVPGQPWSPPPPPPPDGGQPEGDGKHRK